MNLLSLLFPDLALIALGVLLHRQRFWTTDFWNGLERLVYYVLFPALLFGSIVRSPLGFSSALPVIAAVIGATLSGIVLGWLARAVLRPDPRRFASGVQCAFRFNTYLALALASRLGGDDGVALVALLVAFVVPTVNVAAVLALAGNSGQGVLRALLRNPLLLATLAGVVARLAGLELAEPIDATLRRLGAAALGIGLVCVGSGLQLGTREGLPQAQAPGGLVLAAWFTVVKLIAMPLIAWTLARALELPPLQARIALLFAAMPTAPAAYVLASQMGGDARYVARLVTVSTLGALLTLPFWLGLTG